MTDAVRALRAEINEAHDRLAAHPVFAAVETPDDLRLFMSWHVFAVWDFMTLLKRLQRDLTTVTLPWTPPAHPEAARLVNEIVLGEESDIAPGGRHASHHGLYLEAMREIGADTTAIEGFVARLAAGRDPFAALAEADVAAGPAEFVAATLRTALNGTLPQVLGSFFFGRENVIPDMFRGLLARWGIDPAAAPIMIFYLERHIELDSGEHGPAAEAMIAEIVGDDTVATVEMLTAARDALTARRRLWDALHECLRSVERPRAAAE
ncbi:MAG: DUF3050 domain-containing protein [Siculibacillus sp.]|nr:DUF3050 domain-containing protein [Siculibacillus sp.]